MATQFLSTNAADNYSIYTNETTQTRALGTQASTIDGRKFVYVKVGASDLVSGKLYQGAAIVDNHAGISISGTPVVGTTSLTVTLGATAATLNQYAGGTVTVLTGTGAGQTYGIVSNPAADSAATLTLTLADELLSILDGTVTLAANPFNGVIVTPAGTLNGMLAGLAVYPVTTGNYGWVQIYGLGTVIAGTASVTKGTSITVSQAVTGSVTITAGYAVVGTALRDIPVNTFGPIFLTI